MFIESVKTRNVVTRRLSNSFMKKDISPSTLKRLPIYLHYVKSILNSQANVSATQIAGALDFGEVQVRKDLASISCEGKPKVGYPVTVLAREIEEYLGISEKNEAVLVGVGKLGQALLEYNGFSEFGLTITTGFDVRKEIVGTQIGGKPILNASDMENYVRENGTTMGILTVPAKYAQETANNLVKAGIKAIWNFSPTHIVVPETVAVKNENLAASLAVLSKQIKEKNKIL